MNEYIGTGIDILVPVVKCCPVSMDKLKDIRSSLAYG
jgi:hypothetical protein